MTNKLIRYQAIGSIGAVTSGGGSAAAPLRSKQNVRGITLIELMVALTISLVILGAMSQIFVASRTTYNTEEGLARIQESGRFGLDTLAYEIRTGGFFGCGNVPTSDALLVPVAGKNPDPSRTRNNMLTINGATRFDFNALAGVQGFRYTGTTGNNLTSDWTPPLSTSGWSFTAGTNAGDIRAGSDVIVVKYATSNGIKLTNALSDGQSNGPLQIATTDATGIAVNDAVMVTNCTKADFFIVTGLTPAGANTSVLHDTTQNNANMLQNQYGAGDELLRFFANAYYIGNTGRRDKANNPIPALYRRVLVNGPAGNIQPEVLAEGVEAMQIYYGMFSGTVTKVDDFANRFVPANQVTDWTNVASVRVGLVVASTDKNTPEQENTVGNLNLLGITTDTLQSIDNYTPTPNDGRSRRVFSFLVSKRQPMSKK